MENGQQAHQTSQDRQKKYFDRHAKPGTHRIGERVFIYMPAAKTGPAYKLTQPYHGPYRITATPDTGLEVTPVDRPQDTPIRVAFNRARACPKEIGNDFYPRNCQSKDTRQDDPSTGGEGETDRVWTGRLRSIPTGRGDVELEYTLNYELFAYYYVLCLVLMC